MSRGYRVFNIMQYEINPITGEDLHFNETNIISALSHKTFREWAYIYHDKDTYSQKDEDADRDRLSKEFDELSKQNPEIMENISKDSYIEQNLVKRKGELKPSHWHVVGRCDNAVEISDVARWFGVPENMIDIPRGRRGRDGFIDCVRYLTHEDEAQIAQNKYRYPDEEVKANFDWRGAIVDFLAKITKRGVVLNDREYVAHEVCYNGMTLKKVRQNYPEVWVKDMVTLKKMRADYLENLPCVQNRVNFYLCGDGRIGKGLLSRAIARTMFPNMDDDEIFFETGANNVTFEGYDGQPVIIWNDCRSNDIIKKLGSRENVFNTFDTHPSKSKQHVKYGSVSLVNTVNIVNSVQPYRDFLDGLAGEYVSHGEEFHAEDKRQSYERFPVIIPIHAEDFELLFNRSYFYSWENFEQFRIEAKIKASLPRIARACDGNVELQHTLEKRALDPISDKLLLSMNPKFGTDSSNRRETAEEMFERLGYGTLMDITADNDITEEDMFKNLIVDAFEIFQKKLLLHFGSYKPALADDYNDQWCIFYGNKEYISRNIGSDYLRFIYEPDDPDTCDYETFEQFYNDYISKYGKKFYDDIDRIFKETAHKYIDEHTSRVTKRD